MNKKVLRKIKKPVYYIPIAIVIILVGWYIFSKTRPAVHNLIESKRGDIIQTVNVTGTTQPINSVDLAFEKGGKISNIYAQVGDLVSAGQSLAALDASELSAQLSQAQANTASQQAKLDELKKGSRPEDITIAQTQVDGAQIAVNEAIKGAEDKIQDSYTKSDDAIYNKVDQIFSNPRTTPQMNLSVNNSQLKNDVENTRTKIESILNTWKNSLNDRSSPVSVRIDAAQQNLASISQFLSNVASVVNSLSSSSSISQTTIDSYKTDIFTARTNVNTAITNLSTAEEKLNSAKSDLILYQNQLELKKAGSTPEAIASQQAQVDQAQASTDLIRAQLAKTVLRAPISGTVIRQDAKPGQIASAGVVLVSIISQSNLEIEANVSEVDIGKIAVGNSVNMTMDAFPGENFTGKVFYVDPAETVGNGVVNYKIKISFDKADERLKSGLTSNLEIKTISKSGVIILPQYAILQNDQGTFVEILEGNAVKQIPVVLGIQDEKGNVEVLSGVSEHEQVLNIGLKTQ